MRRKRPLQLAAFILAFAAGFASQREEGFAEYLRFLASDELRGRGNDMPELNWAADYIADRFAEFGLQPAGDDGTYFQEFEVTTGIEQGPSSQVAFFAIPQAAILLENEKDYAPITFGGEATIIAPLVFAGFGISAPELGYDDYQGIDVRGKAVVIYDHEPQERLEGSVFGGAELSEYSTVMSKVLTARSRGARAVILLPDSFNHERTWARANDREASVIDLGIQTIRLSEQWGQRLMELSGMDPGEILRWINGHLTPYSFEFVGGNVALRLDIKPVRHKVRNVLGLMPGWSDEFLIVGAHYDHLGLGEKNSLQPERVGEIHNGADDNASGTAGLLQLARDFSKQRSPRRSILFAAFAGEELGLLGSRHFVEGSPAPLEKVSAMLNMDMIGRSEGELLIGGAGTAEEFKPILADVARGSGLRFRLAETPGGSSDHQPFALKGIPVLFFFAGLHADYHRPSDDLEKIDLARSEQVLAVVKGVIDRLQRIPGPLRFVDLRARLIAESQPEATETPYFGSVPDMRYQGGGVRFELILEGSPAAEAGVAAGDTLVEFDGKRVGNLRDFSSALRERRPGDEVDIAVARAGRVYRYRIQLAHRN